MVDDEIYILDNIVQTDDRTFQIESPILPNRFVSSLGLPFRNKTVQVATLLITIFFFLNISMVYLELKTLKMEYKECVINQK